MELGKPGWLDSLLADAVATHRPEDPDALLQGLSSALSPRARARTYVRRMLRESGLLYGTPATGGPVEPRMSSRSRPGEVLFLAVARTFAWMALDVATVLGARGGPRPEQLLVLFAAHTGLTDLALELDRRLSRLPAEPLPKRLKARVEAALAARAPSLSGDPAYGLVLHNGALYADAQAFGRQAIDYFLRGYLSPLGAQRRLQVAARQKALLVEVLTALSCAEREPNFATRRAILRQIEDLQLPDAVESDLRARVKKAFERRPALRTIVRGVRSRDVRRFILEQTLLASLVDGHRSAQELAFIRELSAALQVGADELAAIEVSVAEFYARNRSVVDVFTLAPGVEVMGEEVVESISRTVEKNFHRLMREVRETGELSVLLTRAARGQKLTAEERAKMRAQLIDVAKAIPALAIFAAPGGLLLLVALAKVLPFSLLPSAFQDPPPDAPPVDDAPPPPRANLGA